MKQVKSLYYGLTISSFKQVRLQRKLKTVYTVSRSNVGRESIPESGGSGGKSSVSTGFQAGAWDRQQVLVTGSMCA